MNTAVIIEPRKHKALYFVLNNFLENLSDDWNIIIFHGNLNKEYINTIINHALPQYKHRLSLINLNVNNLTHEQYNQLLIKNRDFYKKIPTETFLIFQTDTMIFSKYKNLINDFLKYDYVGAPWPHEPLNNGQNVGNGGLSLRKKSKMLEIMDKDKNVNLPEDVFFSCTNEVELYKPSLDEAKLFSVENIFSEKSFGCHQPWILKNELLQYFPEIKRLIWLNDKLPDVSNRKITYNYKRRFVIPKKNNTILLQRFLANKRLSNFSTKKIKTQIIKSNMGIRLFR